MVKPNLTNAKSNDDLWAARYDCRFQHRAAAYYDSGLAFVPPNTRRALDAGCGSGAFALPLAERAQRVVGMDYNFTLVALAQARQAEEHIENTAWVVGDITQLPFATGAFDFVGTYNVLHVVPFKPALAELTQSVAEGGRLVIRLPVLPPNYPQGLLNGLNRFYTVIRRRLPRYPRTVGIRTGLRLMVQDLSPAAVALDKYRLPREEIVAMAREQLPGCRVEQVDQTLVLFWEKK